MARLSARVIVLDRKLEYELDGAVYAYSLAEAVNAFCALRWQRFCLIVRLREPNEYTALLEVIMHAQDVEPHGPVVVVAEEFSAYSETQTIHPVFRDAFNQGRHLRLSLVTVIQLDTDVHRVTRGNAGIIVSMAQNRLSNDLAKHFRFDDVARLVSLDKRYSAEPEQDVNFVCSPDVDLYAEWSEVQGVLYVPKGGAESLPQEATPV